MGVDATARATEHFRPDTSLTPPAVPCENPTHHGAPDDLAVILAAQRDPAAFAPLYERYASAINGYCLRRLGDQEAAADATSQIFVRALQRLETFRPSPASTSTVRSWLFAIAHNTVVDTHRRNVFRLHRSLDRPARDPSGSRDGPSSGERLAATDHAADPEEQALARETIDRVRQALTHLPERQRQVVELRLAGLTGAEIAAVLGMTLGAVKAAQFRAFGTLRPLLDDMHAPAPTQPESADASQP
jgi:RNA polymerase sigma-70 factor (ECF subfamily)